MEVPGGRGRIDVVRDEAEQVHGEERPTEALLSFEIARKKIDAVAEDDGDEGAVRNGRHDVEPSRGARLKPIVERHAFAPARDPEPAQLDVAQIAHVNGRFAEP